MLKAVSLAVDLIIANFNSRQDPEEKVLSGVQKTNKQKKRIWKVGQNTLDRSII